MNITRIVVPAMLLALALTAWTVPVGLNFMPTAESLGFLQTRTDAITNSGGLLYGEHNKLLMGAQTGLILGLEGGVDQITDIGAVYNLKWVYRGEGLIMPAFAFGVQNLAKGEHSQYYLVATKSLPTVKVSAGFLRNDGKTATMVGAGAQLGLLLVKVDHLQGANLDRNAASLGIAINRFTVGGAYYAINNGPDEKTITVSYTDAGY